MNYENLLHTVGFGRRYLPVRLRKEDGDNDTSCYDERGPGGHERSGPLIDGYFHRTLRSPVAPSLLESSGRAAKVAAMKLQLLSISVAVLLAGCGQKEEPKATEQSSGGGGYLGSITKAQQTMIGKIDTVAIDQAIARFYTDKGRFPKDLNELVTTRYLSEMPPAPNGKKLEYDPKTGTVKLVAQ